MKVLIIGSGNMGKTYARSFLTSRFIAAKDLFVLDKNRDNTSSLHEIPAIRQLTKALKIVRCMPNLPAQIGMSMTVFTSSPEIDKKELFIVQNLINTTGKSVYVEDENMIDAATAISGSGPAYVYYFMEAMIQAGVKMGFTLAQAELLVNQTFMGAVHLHNQSELTCGEWIDRVASKGGTTEAALKVFKENIVGEKIDTALGAALNRAKELGK
ncbi:MAG: pyrroline-5-carboxylate reductase dimerization domain-containing protein [Bacteroidota bacterium]